MSRKNFLVNLLMILVFIALALGAYYLKVRIGNEKEKTARVNEQVVLKDIYYDSAVTQISYGEAGPIIQDFVGAYNNKNGEMLAQVMDLVATYIYSDCENALTGYYNSITTILCKDIFMAIFMIKFLIFLHSLFDCFWSIC